MKRYLTISNAALVVLAILAVGTTAFAVWVTTVSVPSPDKDDNYPLPLSSEFPVPEKKDGESLKVAVASALALNPERLGVDGIAVLTREGERAGASGLVLDETPVQLHENTTFVVCGSQVSLPKQDQTTAPLGFYVALLDGESTPYHLLPLDENGAFPEEWDLGSSDKYPCVQRQ